METFKSEVRDGMRIDWDAPIEMDDGVVLRCDVYRPVADGKYPVILSYGPYAKWLHLMDGYPAQWKVMTEKHPETVQGTSNRYQNWELADPEKWVPDGYACVRVDSRGAGRSPGFMEIWSPRETKDLYDCIEWAAEQPWCSGKVGLNGISYYAMNQWFVASLQPPHLAAMCVWEGAADLYRDMGHHGGIYSLFGDTWYRDTVVLRQHGRGKRDFRSRINGEWCTGPETLSTEELENNRSDYGQDLLDHPLIDDYWRARMPDFSKITVPAPLRRELGRGGTPSPREHRGVRARGHEAEVARNARPRPFHPFLHRLRREAAEAFLRPLPQGRGYGLGPAAAGLPSRCAIRGSDSSPGPRTSGPWPGPSGRSSTSIPGISAWRRRPLRQKPA